MAAEVKPLPQLLAAAGVPIPLTPDQEYWKTFKNQLLLPSPHNAGITSVTTPDYNPTGSQADTFAVTSGSRVQIFSIKTRKLVKTIGRFGVDDTARSGALRRDGRIMLAGGDSGVVQAFDTGSRAILRQWRGEHAHKQPVHVVRWSTSVLTDLMSASDDRTVRVWDLTDDVAKWTGVGHEDYVRSACYLPGHESMVVSGSYDQTVRVWDTRQPGNGRAALTFKHAAPIEDVITMNSSRLVSAAGNEAAILDLVAGKVEHKIRSHQKTVTALATAQRNTRILTAGLDGHLKIHNTTSWEVMAQFKYPAPILSLAIIGTGPRDDKEDRHLTVGLQSGILSIRTRLAGAEKVKEKEKAKRMDALLAGDADEYERKQNKKDMRQGIRARDRGKDYRGEGADIVITGNDRSRRIALQPWQKSLREGKYRIALDQALKPKLSHNRNDVLALLTALRHRSALRTALSNRTAEQLVPVLQWISKYFSTPRFLDLIYDTLLLLLDLHSHKLGNWKDGEEDDGREVEALVSKIKMKVNKAIHQAHHAQEVEGMFDLIAAG